MGKRGLGERQGPRQPTILLACDKEAERGEHIYIYGETILFIAQYKMRMKDVTESIVHCCRVFSP